MEHGAKDVERFCETGYYRDVLSDLKQLNGEYPFVRPILIPTTNPSPIELIVTAVTAKEINSLCATEEDFLGEYSRSLYVIVPFNYKEKGCLVYGGEWIDLNRIKYSDKHFNSRNPETEKDFSRKIKDKSLLFCVGVPDSFPKLENVILENINTAREMLIAYKLYQTGQTDKLELIAYSHGERGISEFKSKNKC